MESLPFSSVSFADDIMPYTTTPVLLQTLAAVPTAATTATTTTTASADATAAPTDEPVPAAAGHGLLPRAVLALSVAAGIAAFLM